MPPERFKSQEEERSINGGTEPQSGDRAPLPTGDRGESVGEPDVLLDVPVLNVEELDLEVEDLRARISYQAELADMVKINVGIDAEVGKAKIGIQGIEVQAQLKARLDNVRAIFSEVLVALQRDPELAQKMLRTAGSTLDAAERAGETEGGAGQAGRRTVDEPESKTATSSSDNAAPGEGASSLADLPIEEEYVDERGRIVGRARDESGEDVEEILDEEGNSLGPDSSPVSFEDDRTEATDAARRRADELGLKLSGVKGTGSGGRILVKDVENAGRDGA